VRRNAFAPPSPMRGCAEPAAHVRSRESLAPQTLGVRVLKREPAAPLKRSDRLALGGRYYGVSRLVRHRFLRAIVCFQDVARRKISASIFFVMSIPAPAGPLGRGREEGAEGRRRFQFCIERFQRIGRLFLQLPETGSLSFSRLGCLTRAWSAAVPDVVGPRLPRPYHFRARIQSFQAVAAPFPGDSRFAVEPSRAMIPATETPRFKRSTIGSAICAGTALGVTLLFAAG